MNKEEIVKILQKVRDEVSKKYKARLKGIFGSYVKGEERNKS